MYDFITRCDCVRLDLDETVYEDKHVSQDDVQFIQFLSKHIKQKDRHFEMPLPFKSSSPPFLTALAPQKEHQPLNLLSWRWTLSWWSMHLVGNRQRHFQLQYQIERPALNSPRYLISCSCSLWSHLLPELESVYCKTYVAEALDARRFETNMGGVGGWSSEHKGCCHFKKLTPTWLWQPNQNRTTSLQMTAVRDTWPARTIGWRSGAKVWTS